MLYFLTYADHNFYNSKLRIAEEARTCGFDVVLVMSPSDIPPSFSQHENVKQVWCQRRGAGYWIWKPYIVEHVLNNYMKEDDFLLYTDCGCVIQKPIDEWIQLLNDAKKSMLRFSLEHDEYKYTTSAIFEYFGADQAVRASKQLVGGVLLLKKTQTSLQYVQHWLRVAKERPDLFTDLHNEEAKLKEPKFIDNRHDQSISSVLLKSNPNYIADTLILEDPTLEKDAPVRSARKR